MSENKPRKPDLKELLDLQTYLFKTFASKRVIESINQLEQLKIAVFDDYVTDNGAEEWAGKLMVVVWATSPNDHQLFTWDKNGDLKTVRQSNTLAMAIEFEEDDII
jgi:hypothetical protein